MSLDPKTCRRLWSAVLAQCLRDAIEMQGSGMSTPKDQWAARAWIGTRDFRTVCDLAGVNAADVEAYALREMSREKAPRRKKGAHA